MSLRKLAGLLAAFGLTVGLIGGGVGAVFQDQVTAQENIDVGTFACKITDATPGLASDGIAIDGKSLTFTAPTIMSSAAGSAPFSFTVENTGSITQALTATSSWTGNLPGNFSSILATPTAPVTLVAGGTHTYDAGIQWTALDNFALGKAGSITYTVACDELPPVLPAQPDTYQFSSTNAANQAAGNAYAEALWGPDGVTLTFHQPHAYYQCFEYRTDGNVPEQRLAQDGPPWVVGPPFRLSIADGDYGYHGINDLYRYECLYLAGSSVSVGPLAATSNVEVRMAFGAENDQWFGWTSFPKP